jgi:hypothetical protein
VELDVLSWIALAVLAVMTLAVAGTWLLTGPARRFRYTRGALGGLLLVSFLLLAVESFANVGVKEVVLDGWLDSVADSIDGTSDRDERIARDRQGSGRGSLVSA